MEIVFVCVWISLYQEEWKEGDEKTHVYIKPERIGFDEICTFLEGTDFFCVF